MSRKLTQTEKLYRNFLSSTDPAEKERARRSLAAICLRSIGHLTPVWRGKWHPDFDALRYKSRAPWVYKWLDEQLKVPQKDNCRFIGRRCRFALLDEIRRHYRKPREKAEPIPHEVQVERVMERRQELLTVFGKWLRHSTPLTELTGEEKTLVFDSIIKGRPLVNTAVAREWGRSEGYVRKLKNKLLAKMRRAKKDRRDHWEKQTTRARRRSFKGWAKQARRDKTVWWDKKKDGKPFVFSSKK